MSIELRRGGPGGNSLVCDLGEIRVGDPRPEVGRVDRLMLCTVEYAELLLREGPLPSVHCCAATVSVERHGDVMAAHIDWDNRRWTWILHPAHWWDYEGPEILLGVMPAL